MIDFNPTGWIRSFIAVGGTIYLSADGVRIGYSPENEVATEAVRAIGREPESWRAVKAQLSVFTGEARA